MEGNRHAAMNDDDAYFKEWYAEHGETLNKSRRDRYKTDPAYREAVLARNREARSRRRKETLVEKKQVKKATRLRVGARSWKTKDTPLTANGKVIATAKTFTIGALARVLGRSVQAVRLWERQGLLMKTPLRNDKGDRLYTAEMVEDIRKVLSELRRLPANKARVRPERKGIAREIEYADGTREKLRMFRVGVLAESIERTVVTVEILESKGFLPPTPFRASATKYRLYTFPMVEAVRDAFAARGGEIRGEEWKGLYEDVRGAWENLKVFGAKLV